MSRELQEDARAIWMAGLNAVRSDRLVERHLKVEEGRLHIGEHEVALSDFDRLVVVGGGKAGAGMVAGAERALESVAAEKELTGWVNVPADCVEPTRWIHLHAARPAGVNEPRPEGVEGTQRILQLVHDLTPRDLCLSLISGGGSALLVAPAEGLSWEDKRRVTRFLSAAGANIEQMNVVRKQLSRIKGGGLARACRAGWLATLIISDVLGDPLDVIASGPTVEDHSTPQQALDVLRQFGFDREEGASKVLAFLERKARSASSASYSEQNRPRHRWPIVIGNNAVAVDAAGIAADRLGYRPAMISARSAEGEAEAVGRHLAEMALHMRRESGPDCLVSGGEPVVTLAPPEIRGKGGRNQQLALAAYLRLLEKETSNGLSDVIVLSGGTDGEDGPTDAAGAWIDERVHRAALEQNLDPADFLRRSDAYRFFEATGGLLKTGPTHTNVCDVRVVLVRR